MLHTHQTEPEKSTGDNLIPKSGPHRPAKVQEVSRATKEDAAGDVLTFVFAFMYI